MTVEIIDKTNGSFTYGEMLRHSGVYKYSGDSRLVVSVGDGKTAIVFGVGANGSNFTLEYNSAWNKGTYSLTTQKIVLSNAVDED